MESLSIHSFRLLDFSHYNKPSSASALSQQQILGNFSGTLGGLSLPGNREEANTSNEAAQSAQSQQQVLCRQNSNGGIRKFECGKCQKSFKQLAHLNTHALIHEGKRPHKCSYCEQTFSQLTHLKRHLVTHRSGDELRSASTYACHMCPRRFAFPSDLNAHLNKHYTREQRKSSGRGQSQRTYNNTNNNNSNNNTNTSNINNATNNGLVASSSGVGNGEVDKKCTYCERSFQYPSQLREHMFVHTHIRRFPCGECGRSFMKEHHLKVHQQSTHQCLRPHTCHVCHKSFSIKANLERHLFIHSVHKTFECPVCSKRFAQPQTLKMHMVSHNDVKPFQCSVCGKGLARAHNLRAHMAIHRQNKPFSCTECSATFTLKGNLQRHTKEKHSFDSIEPEQSSQQQMSRMISVDEEASQSEATVFDRSNSPVASYQEDQADNDTNNDGRQSEDSLESEIDPVFEPPSEQMTNTQGTSNTQNSLGLQTNQQQQQQQQQQQTLFQPYASCTVAQQAPPHPPPSCSSELFHHSLPVFTQHVAPLPVPVPHPFYAPNATPSDLSLGTVGASLQLLHEAGPAVMMQHTSPAGFEARIQALHAVLDEIAQQNATGIVAVTTEKRTAIHMAVDELLSPLNAAGHPGHVSSGGPVTSSQQASLNQMLDLRSAAGQLDNIS